MKNLIFNDDCFNILEKIEDHSIDHIITDPPYAINIDDWDNKIDIILLTKEFNRILKDNGSIFFFTGWSYVCEVIQDFDDHFKLNDWIVYDRIKGRGAKTRLVSTREDLLWYIKKDNKNWTFHKDKAYSTIKKKTKGMGSKNGQDCRALSNVWTDISPLVPWSKEKYKHPTQKPKAIIKRILDVFTNENDLILDCFMGGGSTIHSCIEMNRNYIGIEKNEYYFNIAKNIIDNY